MVTTLQGTGKGLSKKSVLAFDSVSRWPIHDPYARDALQLHSETRRFEMSQFVHGYRGHRKDETEVDQTIPMAPLSFPQLHFQRTVIDARRRNITLRWDREPYHHTKKQRSTFILDGSGQPDPQYTQRGPR